MRRLFQYPGICLIPFSRKALFCVGNSGYSPRFEQNPEPENIWMINVGRYVIIWNWSSTLCNLLCWFCLLLNQLSFEFNYPESQTLVHCWNAESNHSSHFFQSKSGNHDRIPEGDMQSPAYSYEACRLNTDFSGKRNFSKGVYDQPGI